MNAYRIRKKSTGLFWRGAGNGGKGKWVSVGKVYIRIGDAKTALSAYQRGIEYGARTEYDRAHDLSWRQTPTDLQAAERAALMAVAVVQALSDVEVVEYDLNKGKTMSVEEFRGPNT